jgi:DNA mismatch repair protein MutS2
VGDYVRIKGQNTIGKIEQIQGKNAKVLFGFMHTNIPLSRLEKSKAPENSNTTKEATFVSKTTTDAMREKQLNFKQDVDLRGMRVDEALRAVAYFIDDAIQVGQLRVRILHGTGTGALRQSIRQYLNTVVGVKSYRDEHVQFGGAGITVVDLD